MAGATNAADIVTNPMASAQTALTYGPQTQQALRRSQYLADALRQMMTEGSQNIRSGGELGAKLLATAILQRSNDKGQDALIQAMGQDRQSETDRLLSALKAPAPPAAAQPVPDMAPPAPPPASAQPAPASAPAAVPGLSDSDKLNLARAVWGEARGEPSAGQQAVASVILNRARESGRPVGDIIAQPHQFAGFNPQSQGLTPDQLGPIMANIGPLLNGTSPDPTNGADHFFNPALANPSWGQGDGQMIGQHKFMHLGYGGQPPAQGAPNMPPPPPPPPDPNGPPVQGAQPYQVASTGPMPPPPEPPSAPGSSPPAAGTGAAAPLPQMPAAAAPNPASQWPTWTPSGQEYDYVQSLLMDPRTHAQGVQAAMQMRQKMTQPVEATVQMINGVPYYVPKDPTAGAPTMAIPVPREAMTQHADGPAAGLPPGAQQDVSPLGTRNVVYKPPEGYQAAPGGGLQYQQGGPADPTRPQAPGTGYQYAAPPAGQPGAPPHQEAVPGGPADPRAPSNLAQGVLSFKKDLDPIVTNAMKVRQNFGAVVTGIHQQNGTGDIAAINGLQKLIDEGVVKGEDVTMQMKSNGLDGTLGGYLQYINSGGLLTPEVRAKVAKTASDLYHNLDQTYQARVMSMRPAVDQIYGNGAFDTYVFPKAMVDQMGWGASPSPAGGQQGAPAAAPQFKPGTQDAALAEAARRGLPLSPAQRARAAQLGIH